MGIAASQAWERGDSPGAAPVGKSRLYVNLAGNLVIIDDSGAETVLSSNELSEVIDELSTLHSDTNEPNGFVRSEPDTMGVISFNEANRLFLHEVSSGMTSFDFYSNGSKYSKDANESCVITDITGLHYIYYDADGIIHSTTLLSVEIITTFAIVCIIYWNSDTSEAIVVSDERHGIQMDGITHLNMHVNDRAKYDLTVGGININGLIAGGVNYSNISLGRIWDEDIPIDIPTSTHNEFWYKLGPSGTWNKTAVDNNVAYNGGSGNTYWNEWDGSEWLLSRTLLDCFTIIHFVAVPDLVLGGKIVKIIGQNAYYSGRLARAATVTEIGSLNLDGLPSPEFVYLYSIIVKCDNTLQTLSGQKLYIDFRYKIGAGEDGHVPGVSSHIDLTDSNLMFMTQVSGNYDLVYSDRVVVMTTPDTLILPRTNLIENDGYMRQFWIKNGSSGAVTIETTSPEIFTPGNNKIVLQTKTSTAHVGCVYSADGSNSWMNVAAQQNILQIRRDSVWDASNFSSETAIPFTILDKESNSSVISFNIGNPTMMSTGVHGSISLSYWADIDSTGGSTYTVNSFIRKNGTDEIQGTKITTGNYGNEDQSCSIGIIYVDVEIDDYFEIVFSQSNLTGRISSCTFSATLVC